MAKKKVRIRAKRLDQIAEDRLALAVWLIARDMVADETTPSPPEARGTDTTADPDKETA